MDGYCVWVDTIKKIASFHYVEQSNFMHFLQHETFMAYLCNPDHSGLSFSVRETPAPDKIQRKNKKAVAIKAAALVGILIIGILCYFLTRNNEKYIDVVDAESDQWNESQAEIEFNEIS